MNFKRLRNIFINNTLVVQVIFIVAAATAILLFERFSSKELPVGFDTSKEAALLVDFDNMRRMFAGEVVEGMTVLDALNASVAAGQIKLKYDVDDGNDTKISEIDDHTVNSDTQFTFRINSRELDSSELNKTQIQPGDKVTITLE